MSDQINLELPLPELTAKDKRRIYQRDYRSRNKDRLNDPVFKADRNEYCRDYRKKNSELLRAKDKERKLRKYKEITGEREDA